jgi:hypothetical protein
VDRLLRDGVLEPKTGSDSTFSLRLIGILVNGSPLLRGMQSTLGENVFRKLFGKKIQPLTGAPSVRRMKTYSAESGYVYQYFYEGHRHAQRDGGEWDEFVFHISADRKAWHDTSLFIEETALRNWEQQHGRELSSTERYAIAKLALFQTFDGKESPEGMKEGTLVRQPVIEAIVATLDL